MTGLSPTDKFYLFAYRQRKAKKRLSNASRKVKVRKT